VQAIAQGAKEQASLGWRAMFEAICHHDQVMVRQVTDLVWGNRLTARDVAGLMLTVGRKGRNRRTADEQDGAWRLLLKEIVQLFVRTAHRHRLVFAFGMEWLVFIKANADFHGDKSCL